ncbi:hypothetical protein OKA04_15680 [Luteolibacter flavescens]|uniref:Secreted protein n=1 Tax=Luteolibacter flavescens TaxID=1859460 RepID=A0ABT3FRH4_9BACT|nr:hypothetical protein [Luteolibacter flavescens]MCW1886178.1 hypothetical protein [Luteolibacter flavescens]
MPAHSPSLAPGLALIALALPCCTPIGTADPLDSGEHSAAVLNLGPTSANREEERKLQDDRVRRLSGGSEENHGSSFRGSVGVDAVSDF